MAPDTCHMTSREIWREGGVTSRQATGANLGASLEELLGDVRGMRVGLVGWSGDQVASVQV